MYTMKAFPLYLAGDVSNLNSERNLCFCSDSHHFQNAKSICARFSLSITTTNEFKRATNREKQGWVFDS